MTKVSENSERKSKKGSSSSKKKSTDNPPKVSTEEIQKDENMCKSESENKTTPTTATPMTETTATTGKKQHEVRSILFTIPKDEENTTQCSMEGCGEQAVVEWTSSKTPDEIQRSCENCQPAEFTNDAAATSTTEPKNDVAETHNNGLSKEEEGGTRAVEEDGVLQSNQDAEAAQVSTAESSASSDADAPGGPFSKSTNDECNHDDDASVKSSSGAVSIQDTPMRTPEEELMEVVPVEMTPSSPTVSNMVDEEVAASPLNTAPPAFFTTPKPVSMNGNGTSAGDGYGSDAEGDPMDVDTANATEASNEGGEEGDEQWDLLKVFSEENLTNDPVMCDGEKCEQAACVRYANAAVATDRWSGCLDCQFSEFGGWPETLEEFPVHYRYLTAQHRQAIIQHCSKNNKAQEWPTFLPETPPDQTTKSSAKGGSDKNINTQALTPVPPSHQARGAKGKGKSLVTPSPRPLSSKQPPKAAAKKKFSKAALANIQKWQKEAEAVGGKGVKICFDKEEAKKKVYEFLYDSFRPMTITDVYNVSVLVRFGPFFLYHCWWEVSPF